MLSNGSETHRKSRTDFDWDTKNVLAKICWMGYTTQTLQGYLNV